MAEGKDGGRGRACLDGSGRGCTQLCVCVCLWKCLHGSGTRAERSNARPLSQTPVTPPIPPRCGSPLQHLCRSPPLTLSILVAPPIRSYIPLLRLLFRPVLVSGSLACVFLDFCDSFGEDMRRDDVGMRRIGG